MSAFAFIILLSVICEGLIEWLGVKIPSRYKMYVAAGLGVVISLSFRADLFRR
jgi:hypothetical protein